MIQILRIDADLPSNQARISKGEVERDPLGNGAIVVLLSVLVRLSMVWRMITD